MTTTRVFVAGTMQGAQRGLDIRDQGYRSAIATMLQRVSTTVEPFDPSLDVQTLLADDAVRGAIASVGSTNSGRLVLDELPEPVQDVRATFLRMTAEVRSCDLCIAYLPDGTPSMGTAMEMYAAHQAGVPVITVTSMVSNLAIAAVSTWIVADLGALEELLRVGEVPGFALRTH